MNICGNVLIVPAIIGLKGEERGIEGVGGDRV